MTVNEEFSPKRFITIFFFVSIGLALVFTELTRFSLKEYYTSFYSSFSWQDLGELGWTRVRTFSVHYILTLYISIAAALPFSFRSVKEAIVGVV